MKHTLAYRFNLSISLPFSFLIVLILTLAYTEVVNAQTGVITNIYDDLGRVIAVVDPAGDTVRYNYDAVGNLVSISRQSSSIVSVITFNPTSGPLGQSVTIFGTAFSTTPSQNTVTFNGVTATVTSSTATEIITSVPAGATSGPINVTSPSGSAASSASFTVSTSNAPTITSFTPSIGTTGTAVTITGTNFHTIASKNKTKINTSYSFIGSSTTTDISTNVPTLTASGRITVATPAGSAVSSSDFFIPPSPYGVADVVHTSRMVSGESKVVTLSTPNKIGMVVFDAIAGQRAFIKATSSTISSTRLTLYGPTGTQLGASTIFASPGTLDVPFLPSTGTYTLVQDPDSTYTGTITFTLYLSNDVTGSILPGGSAVTITTTTPGQNAQLTFNGTTNQRVSLRLTSISLSGGSPVATNAYIKKPDGTTLASLLVVSSSGFMDTQTLPATGVYTLVLDPVDANVGSATLTLYDVPADVTGPITPGGSAVTVTTTTPGQNAQLTFSGTATQRVSLRLTSVSLTGGSPSATYAYIKKPDGTTLATLLVVSSSGFMDTQTLPTTGTYTVLLDPTEGSVGSATLTLYDVPADASDTATVGGSAVSISTTVPGQNAQITFSGSSAQQVTVRVTNNTMGMVTVKLLKPDGTQLTSSSSSLSSFNLATQTLPTTGTYKVVIDPSGTNTGGMSITLTNP